MTNAPTKLVSFTDGAGGSYNFPDLQETYNDNFRNLVTRTTRLAGKDGGFDEYGNDPAPGEIGSISFRFNLEAATRGEMQAKRDAVGELAAWGKQRLTSSMGDQPTRWCYARVNNIGMSQNFGMHTDLFQPVALTFQVEDPFWYAQGTEVAAWGTSFWGATNWGAGGGDSNNVSGTLTSFTLDVGGNALTYPRIVVKTGGAQAISSLSIERVRNGVLQDQVEWINALGANQNLEINCRYPSVRLNNSPAYGNSFQFLRASFFRLFPGSNTINVRMQAGNAATVIFYWFERYR